MEELAKTMGVSVSDAQGFVDCLRVWIDKGFSLDEAIERHQAQMVRMVNNAVTLADRLSGSKEFVGGLHDSMRWAK